MGAEPWDPLYTCCRPVCVPLRVPSLNSRTRMWGVVEYWILGPSEVK